MKGIYTFPW